MRQTRPGGKAGHAEDAKPGLDRRLRGIKLAAGGGLHDRVVAPGVIDEDLIAGVQAGVVGLKDAGHGLAGGRVAEGGGCCIGTGVGHPAAHVGIKRQPFHLQQDLARAGIP